MKKIIVIVVVLILSALLYTVSYAEEGTECTVGTYQGAPIDICPQREPDPTNCYTGWYQGATIEVCMPTGDTLPADAVYHDGTPWAGQPVVIHNSANYIPPTTVAPTTTQVVAPVNEIVYTRQELIDLVTIATYFYK